MFNTKAQAQPVQAAPSDKDVRRWGIEPEFKTDLTFYLQNAAQKKNDQNKFPASLCIAPSRVGGSIRLFGGEYTCGNSYFKFSLHFLLVWVERR